MSEKDWETMLRIVTDGHNHIAIIDGQTGEVAYASLNEDNPDEILDLVQWLNGFLGGAPL